MAIVTVNDANLSAIANAIRGKNGLTDTYLLSEMASAITAIPTSGGGAEATTGAFTPISEKAKITIEHGLSGVPDVFYCIVCDEGVSQEATQALSFWIYQSYLGDKQIVCRSYSGEKNRFLNAASIQFVSSPDTTNIYFGGTSGTMYAWAVGYEYTWTAIYLGGGA